MADPGFPRQGHLSQRWWRQPIILANFLQKMHKNGKKKNWTERRGMHPRHPPHTPAIPWIRQWILQLVSEWRPAICSRIHYITSSSQPVPWKCQIFFFCKSLIGFLAKSKSARSVAEIKCNFKISDFGFLGSGGGAGGSGRVSGVNIYNLYEFRNV